MKTRTKLARLRELMEERGLAAYIVPSTDPHHSEYVPECWQRRAWISGFTGSAGDVVVTRDKAGLWTDGRYFLQAEEELKGSGIKLYRMGQKGVPGIGAFLQRELGEGEALGADPRVLPLSRAAGLEAVLAEAGASLELVDENLVDAVWEDQPPLPTGPVRPQPASFAGESVASKLRRIRRAMKERGAEALVLTTLDSVAWTFNVRGDDVAFNPVVISYGIVTARDASFFVKTSKVDKRVRSHLGKQVRVRRYEGIEGELARLGRRGAAVWVDAGTASRWVVDRLEGARLITEPTCVEVMKSVKNEVELKGMRQAHLRDGVAMVRFLRWLEEEVPTGRVSELSAAAKLESLRRKGRHFQGLSFNTISGYAEHGAIIHYAADEASNAPLKPRGVYLVDSGGQYSDGTTDITRTWLLGDKATRRQRETYTRVLKGHIALARARFPEGVRGMRLDTLARLPLWEAGLDYGHGTGHGVGAYLNVHEGPVSISPTRCTGFPLQEGNILSNEPGYYEPGGFGIRIENLVAVQRDEELSRDGAPWLRFETLTCCPLETRLLEPKLLDETERRWVNDYHRWVKQKLGGKLGEKDRKWLTRACKRI